MDIYFAPLEGITGYLYRNAFHDFFDCGIGKYFTPFIAVSQNGLTKTREVADVAPAHNQGMTVIPQLLGSRAGEMKGYFYRMQELGYGEINLNLGCPYQTVVSKKKGAGLLADTDFLKEFLDEVFRDVPVKISIKTRIGMEKAQEFAEILKIYNQYPLEELIVHPRVRADFYENHLNLEAFAHALEESKAPVCYNGDIFTLEDYRKITERFPKVERVMLGRGLLANPGLLSEILTGKRMEKEEFKAFHDRIYEDYRKIMQGDTNTLFKMKELWNYMQFMFGDREKAMKKIRKAKGAVEYESAVNMLFASCPFGRQSGR